MSDALKSKYGISNVFKDVTDIKGGAHFPSEIQHAISSSTVIIVVIGTNWTGKRLLRKDRICNDNDWIRKEIESALNAGTHLLPVLLNGATMPDKDDLPTSIQLLPELNAVTVRDAKWEEDIEDVFKEIDNLAQQPPLEYIKTEEARNTTNYRTKLYTVFLFLAIAAAVFISLKYFGNNESGNQQASTGDWKSKVVQLTHPKNKSQSTAFFISNSGHILSIGPGTYKESNYQVTTSDTLKSTAKLIGSIYNNGYRISILKCDLKNTPYLNLSSHRPEENSSLIIYGIEGRTPSWKLYTARVSKYSNNLVFYQRPEFGWIGMMGAPIIDAAEDKVFGAHIGTTWDSVSQKQQKNLAQGICFTKGQLDSLANFK